MGWIKDKAEDIGDILEYHPRLNRLIWFYIILAFIALWVYEPLMVKIANLTILSGQPFNQLIVNNYEVLRWGYLAIPAAILFYGFIDVLDSYENLKHKRLRY